MKSTSFFGPVLAAFLALSGTAQARNIVIFVADGLRYGSVDAENMPNMYRLKTEGVTFEQVLDGLRRRLALKLVRDPALPVKELAWRLGFSDPAAFSRAFKRWTGKSPRAFRSLPRT